MEHSLSKRSAHGVLWLLIQNGGVKAIVFLSQIALARILRPTDFGDVALANSVSAILITIAGFGIDFVLLSRAKKFRVWAASAFWASLFLSTLGAITLVVTGQIAARIFRSPNVPGLMLVIATSMPLSALATLPTVSLRLDMKFRFLATYSTLEMLGMQLLTILLALWGLGPFSFVIPVPLSALVKTIVFWRVSHVEIVWKVRKWHLWLLLKSGSASCMQRLITALRENGDYMLLGALTDRVSVGLYYMAFKLAAVPVYTLATSLSGVLFPALAHLRREVSRQRTAVLSASRAIALCIIPLSFAQAAVAGPLIRLVFGAKWAAAAPMMSLLSIGLAFDIVPCIAGTLMDANGKFKAQLNWALGSNPAFLLFIWLGCLIHGAIGVAAGVALFFLIMGPAYSYFALHRFGCSARDIAGIYLPPALCAAITVSPVFWVSRFPQLTGPMVAAMVAICTVGLLAYAALIAFISPVAVRDTVRKFSMMWGRTV